MTTNAFAVVTTVAPELTIPLMQAEAIGTVQRGGVVHLLYRVGRRDRDVEFRDVDGSLLIALHYFDSEIHARAFAAADRVQ